MSYYPPTTVIPIYSVYMVVALFLTALRFWVRLSYARTKISTDDYLLLAGLFVSITCNGIQYYNSLKGTGGEAVQDQDESAIIISHQIDWAMIVIEKAGFGAIKLSILFFYRRIFGIWGSFRRSNNLLVWIVALWTITFTLADVLICGKHPELIWGYDQTIPLHRCGNRGALLLAFSVTSVATDLPVLGLPFFYINRLQMPTGKKWATSFVFLLGAVSTGASILRMIFLIVSYPVGRLNFAYKSPPDDQTPLVLKIFNPTFWAMTELWLGVWAANLPPCAPLLRGLHLHPLRAVSNVYRRTWTRTSAGEDQNQEQPKAKNVVEPEQASDISSFNSRRHRDSAPLVGGKDGDGRSGSGISSVTVISEKPPVLDSFEWSGTGRLSMFSRLPSTESLTTRMGRSMD
ncbi:hypothetical protein GGS20DRAFT_523703 [Poronia punctata]|nr:hypothetical protein GGS20DRAFT_523703 [Poronia punctata]